MLQWLADEPYAAIRSRIEGMLQQQVSDSRLKELRVTSAPQWLTGVRPSETDDTQSILARAGVAFEFVLSVESEGKLHQLCGVYTWVVVHLDQVGQGKQRVWMDLDGTLTSFGSDGELMSRVFFELELEG